MHPPDIPFQDGVFATATRLISFNQPIEQLLSPFNQLVQLELVLNAIR